MAQEAQRKRSVQWRARWTLLRELPRTAPVLSVCVPVLMVAGAGMNAVTMLASGRLVASVPGAVRSGFDSPPGRQLTTALAVVAAVFVLQSALQSIQQLLTGMLQRRVDARIRRRVMEASLGPTGIAHLEDPRTLDKVRDAQGIGTGLFTPGAAVQGMVEVGSYWLAVVASAVLVARYFHVWAAIALPATVLLSKTVSMGPLMRTLRLLTGQTSALRRADYHRELALAPEAAKETRIFGLGNWILDRFGLQWTRAMAEVWRERGRGLNWAILGLIPNLGLQLACIWVVGVTAARGRMSLEFLAILFNAIPGAANINLSDSDMRVQYGTTAVPAVAELERATSDADAEGGVPAEGRPAAEIRFEGVAFRYPGRTGDVFSNLDLRIEAGRSLAVVGANGAGKTTLVKLLARLYDPTAGRITVDGIDLRQLDPHAWQSRIASIFQDFVRYELSAADNVGFGAAERLGDREGIAASAEEAGIRTAIEALPRGWDTVLSREFSDGAELSGGQWQRVALARALFSVRGGARVLVLDEPTANLDVRAEADLFDRFLDLTRGLTTILISHRFSSVRHADRIVVLEHGRIVEDGSHDELIALGGRYAEMFRLQASRFGSGEPGGTDSSDEVTAHA